MRARVWIPASLLVCAALGFTYASHRKLTLAQVNEDLGPDPDLSFIFATGPDNAGIPCARMPPPSDDGPAQTATAIAAGWISRRCEHGHIQLELTEEARRRSAAWSRSGQDPSRPAARENPNEWTSWFVSAARFERVGDPEILPTSKASRMHVTVNGRWLPSADGEILQKAGWAPLRQPAAREVEFERRLGGWRMLEDLRGRDLSGM